MGWVKTRIYTYTYGRNFYMFINSHACADKTQFCRYSYIHMPVLIKRSFVGIHLFNGLVTACELNNAGHRNMYVRSYLF